MSSLSSINSQNGGFANLSATSANFNTITGSSGVLNSLSVVNGSSDGHLTADEIDVNIGFSLPFVSATGSTGTYLVKGSITYNVGEGKLQVYDGTKWKKVSLT